MTVQTKIADDSKCIETCNDLLRGEIAAVKSYRFTLENYTDNPAAMTLREIFRDHQDAVTHLTERIKSMDGIPATESGSWGTFTMMAQNAASLYGEKSALMTLLKYENHNLSEYRDALHGKELGWECKDLIRRDLVRMAKNHIEELERLSEEN